MIHRPIRPLLHVLSALIFMLIPATGEVALADFDPDLFAGMQARAIGPAGMSGRIADIDAVEANPDTIYVGAATGGLWKSVNRGVTWEPIFDAQPVQAIGAVSIFQANPDIVWVGTGEGNTRNSISVGNGIYKSIDAGRSWTHLGLEATERIHRIVLHPTDPDTAWIAAMGRTWGENPERGVFKTTDGGKTWDRILYVDVRTGAADLVIDPSNPDRLFAAMWEHRRWPWLFRSGGPGSGLYATGDGGATWNRMTPEDGLPAGELGRIGVAFCRSQPDTVYALVEAELSALLRSDDGGRSWRTVNSQHDIAPRPFYYADLRVDPERPGRVYNLWSLLSVSDDGGRTFEVIAPYSKVHPDHHALWIDPNDPDFLIDGNDGGVAISEDRGSTWRFITNLPLAQYYHISVDMLTPYNIYGGMQDNGSWRGPSAVWENAGIRNHHWEEVGFGDGFDTLPDPEDPLRGYSMSQRGFLRRWDLRTGERKDIRPPMPDGIDLRFNWNAALAIDPVDPSTIYYGSQFVHKSTDRGDTWTIISPDLTTDNPEWQRQAESGGLTPDVTGAENFTSIVAIAPSQVGPGVIWVGTDDGRLHLTRDGGRRWKSIEDNLHPIPDDTWIPHIAPSRFDAGTAFIVFDDHRRSNWTPYVLKTENYGGRWQTLADEDDLRGYVLSFAQDPVDPDLLFVGTEFGLYVSLDGGDEWMPWRHGVPAVGVRDLVVHPREHDLVIGTHGRSALILDDITPLREISEETLEETIHLYPIADARQHRVRQTGASPRFAGHADFRGENRPYGALLTYSLDVGGLPDHRTVQDRLEKQKAAKERRKIQSPDGAAIEEDEDFLQVDIRITDAGGEIIRTFQAPAHTGINRAVWDLRRNPFREPPGSRAWWRGETKGPEVLPGRYGVSVAVGEIEVHGEIVVLPDPRESISDRDRLEKDVAVRRAGSLQELIADAIDRIGSTRTDIDTVIGKVEAQQDRRAGDGDTDHQFFDAAEILKAKLTAVEKTFWAPPDTKGYIKRDDVLAKIDYVLGSLQSTWEALTPAQATYLRQAEETLGGALDDLNRLFDTDIDSFRRLAGDQGLELFPDREPLQVP
jgi:photosystem II stability/assembly factor-like uncharacterized protein